MRELRAEMEGEVRRKEVVGRRLDQATRKIDMLVGHKASLMDTLKCLQQDIEMAFFCNF